MFFLHSLFTCCYCKCGVWVQIRPRFTRKKNASPYFFEYIFDFRNCLFYSSGPRSVQNSSIILQIVSFYLSVLIFHITYTTLTIYTNHVYSYDRIIVLKRVTKIFLHVYRDCKLTSYVEYTQNLWDRIQLIMKI